MSKKRTIVSEELPIWVGAKVFVVMYNTDHLGGSACACDFCGGVGTIEVTGKDGTSIETECPFCEGIGYTDSADVLTFSLEECVANGAAIYVDKEGGVESVSVELEEKAGTLDSLTFSVIYEIYGDAAEEVDPKFDKDAIHPFSGTGAVLFTSRRKAEDWLKAAVGYEKRQLEIYNEQHGTDFTYPE